MTDWHFTVYNSITAAIPSRDISIHPNAYTPYLQESTRGTIYGASNYPDMLLEMPRYCYSVVIFYLFF